MIMKIRTANRIWHAARGILCQDPERKKPAFAGHEWHRQFVRLAKNEFHLYRRLANIPTPYLQLLFQVR